MKEEFKKNAINDWRTITVESIINMTRAFNLKDFFSQDFEGMAEIVVTPNQIISIYGEDSMFHDRLIGYILRHIMDATVFNPIISIRCRSGANMSLFYPELLRNNFAITEDMNRVLEMLYEQLKGTNAERYNIFKIIVSLEEFREDEKINVVKDISDIPKGGKDKNMIGIPIEEFIKLNQERNQERDDELEI